MNRRLIAIYRLAQESLVAERLIEFPHGCCVRVNSARYKGVGVAMTGVAEHSTPDVLPVRLENGNTWHYPAEDCQRIRNLNELSTSARRSLLQAFGIKSLATPCSKLP